jgi:hypothetical protein
MGRGCERKWIYANVQCVWRAEQIVNFNGPFAPDDRVSYDNFDSVHSEAQYRSACLFMII